MSSTASINTPNNLLSSSKPSAFGSGQSERTGLGTSSDRPTSEAVAHSEGVVARTIEEQTAKLPSDVFLWAAFGSMAISLGLKLAGKKENSLFVGQWAAPFLLLGVYNKLVKIGGSDRVHDR